MIVTATLKSTGQKISAELKEKKYVRLLLWGGARKASDNSSFYYASLNVKKDYGNDGEIIHKAVNTAKSIVNLINSQEDSSIQSVDLFFHGSQYALYMVRDAMTKEKPSISDDISDKNVESNNLYASKSVKFTQSWGAGDDEDVINNINFSKFTNNCKIEIHGCNSTKDTIVVDNIVKNLSEYLYQAGKENAVVIGHSTKANPNLPSTQRKEKETDKQWEARKIREQDYRHGKRIVYNNGKIILIIKKEGRVTASEIKKSLKMK